MYYVLSQDLDEYSFMAFFGHSERSGKLLWTMGVRFAEPYPQDTFYVRPNMDTMTAMPDF